MFLDDRRVAVANTLPNGEDLAEFVRVVSCSAVEAGDRHRLIVD
jgi:hypothetical protein